MRHRTSLFVSIPLALAAFASVAAAQEAAPIRHWTFDRDTIEGARCVEGILGDAAAFDGEDDSLVLGDVGQFESATVAFWMKADAAEKDDWQGLVTSDAWEAGVFHVDLRAGRIEAILHLGETRRAQLSSAPIKNGIW